MTLHRLHNLLFWILLACFLVTTGSVLFFTFGYRFSFERGIFVYTGSITIKSNPRDVRIFLDGKPFPGNRVSEVNRTLHITGLRPGTHLLRVEADGFRSWEKKVSVQSGVSTEFWNIILPRESYERTAILEGGLLEAFFSPREHRFAVATEENGMTRILILDRDSEKVEMVFESDDLRFDHESAENIEWAPDGDKLLVPFQDHDGIRTVLLIDLRTLRATDWREEADSPELHAARWDPTDNQAFFALSEGHLLRIVPEERDTGKRISIVHERVATYDLSGWTVYFAESGSDTVFRATLGGQTFESESLPTTIPGLGTFTAPKISVYDQKRIALHDEGGKGYLINDDGGFEPKLLRLGDGVRGVQFSDDGKKLLFFSDNEISVVFIREWEMQPARENGEIVQVARFSSPVFHPKWSRDYEHVLFSEGHEMRIAELDHRDRRNIVTVDAFKTTDTVTQLLPDFEEDRIYALSRDETGKATLSFIRFPEPVGFFE